MTTEGETPQRGEVWRVNFDPTVGAEIRKTRPAIVISSNSIGRLPLKLVVPVTGWQETFEHNAWHVKLEPDMGSGLKKVSAADTLQVRGVDSERFVAKIGGVSQEVLDEIAVAIAIIIEFEPSGTQTTG